MVLDAAITASGLTLHRVSARVAELGEAVSPATLSLWRRGRSRPGARAEETLRAIEAILDLPQGGLSRSLEVSTVGSPEWWRQSTPPAAALRYRSVLDWALEAWDFGDDDGLRDHVVRDTLEIDDQRRVVAHHVVRFVTADRATDRTLAIHLRPGIDESGHWVVPVVGRSVAMIPGRRVHREREGLAITEMHLDPPLEPDESRLFELTMRPHPGPAVVAPGTIDEHEVRTTDPLGVLALEVRFDPRCLPARVWCEEVPVGDPVELEPTSGVVSASVSGRPSAGLRIAWEWPS